MKKIIKTYVRSLLRLLIYRKKSSQLSHTKQSNIGVQNLGHSPYSIIIKSHNRKQHSHYNIENKKNIIRLIK